MKKLKYYLRSFFEFSGKEVNGFLWLTAIMIILLLTPYAIETLYEPDEAKYNDQKMLDSLIAVMEAPGPPKAVRPSNHITPSSLTYFNPNDATEKQLREIFSPRIARIIVRYREKGGRFFQKQDLKKIYGMDSAIYARVERYIHLPVKISKAEDPHEKHIPKREYKTESWNINEADTTALQKIKGIGKVLSARIVKYRSKLGGFISKEQYQEVFGLDSQVVSVLTQRTFISEGFIPVRLSVNTLDAAALGSHPYIGRKNAHLIVNYRIQHAHYTSLEDLHRIKGITREELLKMMPYLDL